MLPSLDGTVPASLSAQRRPPLAAVELFGAGTVAAGSGAVTEFGVTAYTPGVFTSSSAASSWRTAPNPLMTGTSPVVLWPPRSATTCWPWEGATPGSIWTMYSAGMPSSANASRAAKTRIMQSAAESATANRSLKTMVSSDMLESFLRWKWIRQLSRLYRP